MLRLDHLVFAATDLNTGIEWMAEKLGVAPSGGGQHALMGTHNALWGLGRAYLEVITVDPAAAPPGRARWFGLDSREVAEKLSQGPGLLTWVARSNALTAEIAQAPRDPGPPLRVTRDALYWDLTVPEDGKLIWEGAYPTLIEWPLDVRPPSGTLPDTGLRLTALRAEGPTAYLADLDRLGVAPLFDALTPAPRPSVGVTVTRADGRQVTFQS